jgi:hypothetical protein
MGRVPQRPTQDRHKTWGAGRVSLENKSDELVSIVGIFSAPGFENHMRCEPVPANRLYDPR